MPGTVNSSAGNGAADWTPGRARYDGWNKNQTRAPWERSRIITHGYVAGGYKNANPWYNVNRTVHNNDTSTNLGDIMNYAASYVDGANSDRAFYIYGGDNSFSGYTSRVWKMNLSNASSQGMTNSMNVSRNDMSCMTDYHHQGAKVYITGGGNSTTDRTNMQNDTNNTVQGSGQGGDYSAGAQGRLRGWSKTGGTAQYLTWSTETWSGWSGSPGTNGWGKACSSYLSYMYWKNGGNCTTDIRRVNDFTGANMNAFNVQNSGEENFQMGNFKGYCLGHYNGAQNNNSYKWNYLTDSYADGGGNMQPKGHDGMSSAGNASAYTFNNYGYGISPPSY